MSVEQKKHTHTPQLEWKRKYHRCRIPKKKKLNGKNANQNEK